MIYRVVYYDECEGSLGCGYFSSKQDAIKESKKPQRGSMPCNEIDLFETPTTKKQMIAILNRWGGHPDNG